MFGNLFIRESVCLGICLFGNLSDYCLGIGTSQRSVTSRSAMKGPSRRKGEDVVAKKRAHGPVCILWLKSIKCVARHLRSLKSNFIYKTIYRSVTLISRSDLRILQDSRRICRKRDVFRQPQTKIPPTILEPTVGQTSAGEVRGFP